jgi:protein-S-isoprenylcysteine O-methyltransferase Ste14
MIREIMPIEYPFGYAFWIILLGMTVIQTYFAIRTYLSSRGDPPNAGVVQNQEGIIVVIRMGRAVLFLVFLVLFAFQHPWLEILHLPIPEVVQWLGFILGLTSLVYYGWARATLGRQWSSKIVRQVQPQLVTIGPYARIRHPIYLAMIVFLSSLALLAANGLMMVFLVISLVDLAIRIPKEEYLLLDIFGFEYEAYKQRTGALFPKCPGSKLNGTNP